jgi:hypothetical protein
MKISCLFRIIQETFSSKETLDAARTTENAFTRNRSMPFEKALYFLLDMRKTTLQTRLNAFVHDHGVGETISQQSLSKLRSNFDHSPFQTTVQKLIKKAYSSKSVLKRWNGYLLFGVDGSYFQLPRVETLRIFFGVRDGSTCPNAGISILFDVLNGFAIDSIITGACMNERIQFEKHLDFLSREFADNLEKIILLIDRGYPSQKLLTSMCKKGFKFVARCQSNFLKVVNAAPMGDSVVTLNTEVSVRVIKFELKNGNTQTLVTNVFDLPMEAIIEVYTLRWGIETMYFKLKRELSVEKFSGRTENSIRQDFWVSMLLLNSIAIFQKEADYLIHERQKEKSLMHEYHARTSDLIITLRDRSIFTALSAHSMLTELEIGKIIETMARSVSSIRHGRSFPRIFKPYFNVKFNNLSHL